MTTILAMRKEKAIYCDCQVSIGTKKLHVPTKIFKIKHADGAKELLAGCGSWDKVKAFVAWYEEKAKRGEVQGEQEEFKPLEPPNIEGTSFIVVNEEGAIFILVDQGQWAEITDDFVAAGSGGDFATGALEAGASPLKAMKIAHKYDTMTGPLIKKESL